MDIRPNVKKFIIKSSNLYPEMRQLRIDGNHKKLKVDFEISFESSIGKLGANYQ